MVMGSMIGKCMFASTLLGGARALYIKEVTQSLIDLEHNDFVAEELGNYRTLMGQKVSSLKSLGHRRMAWQMKSLLFNEEIVVHMTDPHDEWKMRLNNRAKAIGVNTRQLKALWHEDILFTEKAMTD